MVFYYYHDKIRSTFMTKYNKKIAVIGLGYVGLPLALLADQKGYQVVGLEIDITKVDKINKKVSPIKDNELQKQLSKSKIVATLDYNEIKNAETLIICVPTPVNYDKSPNYEYLENTIDQFLPVIKSQQLVIIESTVNPGTIDQLVCEKIKKTLGWTVGQDIYVAHVPERINPGDKLWTIKNISRIIGANDAKSLSKAMKFYSTIIEANIHPMESIREAEAVKIVENSFRDVNIAFVNELAMSFDKLGININNVLQAATTKPFAFMQHKPGCGVGGHCIPVDPYYLIDYANRMGFNHKLLAQSRKINNFMPIYTVDKLEKALAKKNKQISGSKVAVLGLSYKANIDDSRESPALVIIDEIEKRGASVVRHDPYLANSFLEKTIEGVDAVLIATDHNEYIRLSPEDFIKWHIDIVIDGRNCLDYKKFKNSIVLYSGIGL